MNSTSNFRILEKQIPLLYNIGKSAEYHLHADPNVTIYKMRQFGEKAALWIADNHPSITFSEKCNQNERLYILRDENILDEIKIYKAFRTLQTQGNEAVHEGTGNINQANFILKKGFHIANWLIEVYTDDLGYAYKYEMPPNLDARHAIHLLEQEKKQLETNFKEALELLKEVSKQRTKEQEQAIKRKAFNASRKIQLTEAETRELIDEQLRQVGWEVDTVNLKHSKGARPEKGKNKAIAEWKTANGRADYALFVGLKWYGIIEAKKKSDEPLRDFGQPKRYALAATDNDKAVLISEWDNYKVPFLFTTNSQPYHYELEEKSGTWFLDIRVDTNRAKALKGWFSPADLERLYKKDLQKAQKTLEQDKADYLTNKKGLNLRDYQLDAVEAVEREVSKPNADRALLAMATGTGKTRTVLGICYRLIKSKRFNRILFLTDRRTLGEQAADTFKDVKIENLNTFAKIYDIKEIGTILPELDTKVHFSTVQGMYLRIFNQKEGAQIPSVGAYDCIIVDEAHRGYALDKKMDEGEIHFKDQSDYRSKYKQVLDYFEAFRIGLTATPAPHTKMIFGEPVFYYPYTRAVAEGHLIPYEPPYIIKTLLNQEGITWEKGDTIKVYNPKTRAIEELDDIEDVVHINVSGFNKTVITDNFTKAALVPLARAIDPDGDEKTLIFAVDDKHADKIVDFLKDAFEEEGILVKEKAIKKITGYVDKPIEAIKTFRNEKYPTIVVTVDLLTTGVDVPKICNLVFLRRVGSRILYEQMLGRATRKADEINKTVFKIYDAVGLYKSMEQFSNMKTKVRVANPTTTLEKLVDELETIEQHPKIKEEVLERQIEYIIDRINRKKKHVKDEKVEEFKTLSDGLTPDEYIQQIRSAEPKTASQIIRDNRTLIKYIDQLKQEYRPTIISEHADEFQEMTRDYSITDNPSDYLEEFKKFIEENPNQLEALEIVKTNPKSLTRDQLKRIRLELQNERFFKDHLDTAWKKAKNEDITADLIAYIRALSMGTTLESPAQRIHRAMTKIRKIRDWNAVQLRWLETIEEQLKANTILQVEDLNQGIFRAQGGFKRLNKLFKNELTAVIETINEEMYKAS